MARLTDEELIDAWHDCIRHAIREPSDRTALATASEIRAWLTGGSAPTEQPNAGPSAIPPWVLCGDTWRRGLIAHAGPRGWGAHRPNGSEHGPEIGYKGRRCADRALGLDSPGPPAIGELRFTQFGFATWTGIQWVFDPKPGSSR